ncbi:MAG: hypothetical protein EBX95_14125 [Acidimicrobiia bacterium]|nr:hypothetical protein [Acidimicrobiia bacterium]
MLAEIAARDEQLDPGRAADAAVFDGFRAELHLVPLEAILAHRLVTGAGWRDFDQRQHRDHYYLQHRDQ